MRLWAERLERSLEQLPGEPPKSSRRVAPFAAERQMRRLTHRGRALASRDQVRRESHEAPLLDRTKRKQSLPDLPSNAGRR